MNDQALEQTTFDDEANAAEAMREKMADLMTPGYQSEFDPSEAEQVGAFVEDAISEDEALGSTEDLLVAVGQDNNQE